MEDARGSIGAAGPQSPFDRLPDDLVLRILIEASAEFYDHDSNHASASLNLVCQLRAVCCRFDRIIPGVDRLFFNEGGDASKLLCFVQERRALKSFYVNAGHLSPLSLQGVLGAAPQLERLMIVDPFQQKAGVHDERLQDLFRCLSGCHQLKTLELNYLLDAKSAFHGALSSRHQLRRLTTLSLTHVELDDAWLLSITRVCPNLQKLNLEEVSGLECPVILSESLTSIVFRTMLDRPGGTLYPDVLEIKAPELLDLKIAHVPKSILSAPSLQSLRLERALNIVKRTEWKVSLLEIKETYGTLEDLLHILKRCSNAKVILIGKAYLSISGEAYKDQVKLLNIFHCFKHLEELHIPLDMSKFLLAEQVAAMNLEPLMDLKRLKIGFEESKGLFNLCLALIKLSPKLERLEIDLTNIMRRDVAIDDLVGLVLRLQRMYPSLKVVADWPKHCSI